VTARQTHNLEAEFAQPFLRKVDLPMFKGVFVTTANKERELTAISLEEVAEVEPVALRFVIGCEASCSREVEPAIVAVYSVVDLADLGVRDLIDFGPHNSPQHHLEHGEGARQTLAGPVGDAAQDRRGVPRVRVPAREKPTIEDVNPTYFRAAYGFALLRALKAASQMLQDD